MLFAKCSSALNCSYIGVHPEGGFSVNSKGGGGGGGGILPCEHVTL